MRVLNLDECMSIAGGDEMTCNIAQADYAAASANYATGLATFNIPLIVVSAVQMALASVSVQQEC